MIEQIYTNIIYFLKLTITPDVLWNIIPLFGATILILMYFEKYSYEKPGWESYMSNSLVLLFVSMSLFKYIYDFDIYGAGNFLIHSNKSIATVFLLLIGSILLRFNFERLLPEKIVRHLSSTLTIHLIAYGVILFVYSKLEVNWAIFISLIILILIISAILNLLRFPLRKIFILTERAKEKELVKNKKEAKFEVDELKKDIKEKKDEVKVEKKEINKIRKLIHKKPKK